MDYRNAIKFYQYDPTKWFIKACSWVGLASHLKTFSENEVGMGQYTMELKRLRKKQDNLKWPKGSSDLPIVPWASFTKQAEKRALVVVAGFIHDVSGFLDEHPGGRAYLLRYVGKDATTAFFGGVYEHSNAGHNVRFLLPHVLIIPLTFSLSYSQANGLASYRTALHTVQRRECLLFPLLNVSISTSATKLPRSPNLRNRLLEHRYSLHLM